MTIKHALVIPNELLDLRQENSKTYDLGDGKRQLVVSIGAIHYKDSYTFDEQWEDIDLNWEGNRITKAPYELILEGNKATIKDKKSGEVSTIELLEIGGIPIPAQAWEKSKGLAKAFATDLEIVAGNSIVKFARILKSDKAPLEAKYQISGRHLLVRARDEEGELPVEVILVDGILTETLKPDRPVKYPVRIDPTWQVGASTDDCLRRLAPLAWSLTADSQYGGRTADAGYTQYGGGMRFTNITIPQGTTILDGTKLTLRAEASRDGTVCNTRVSAEDVDDAITFADDASDFSDRWALRTTARVDWNNLPSWVLNTDYDSPEIKTVIKEIVDRALWVSGNDIVIFWDDFDNRSSVVSGTQIRTAYSFDSAGQVPKLVINYSPPVLGGSSQIILLYNRMRRK